METAKIWTARIVPISFCFLTPTARYLLEHSLPPLLPKRLFYARLSHSHPCRLVLQLATSGWPPLHPSIVSIATAATVTATVNAPLTITIVLSPPLPSS
ncbi:hypothetical protein E4T56_gene19410 [Termitomyces sp. T112]|nr:hypothetical protein E4T56_gene19410 [Termitomyces sp. T112]